MGGGELRNAVIEKDIEREKGEASELTSERVGKHETRY
jgi:hypothetical protein